MLQYDSCAPGCFCTSCFLTYNLHPWVFCCCECWRTFIIQCTYVFIAMGPHGDGCHVQMSKWQQEQGSSYDSRDWTSDTEDDSRSYTDHYDDAEPELDAPGFQVQVCIV